MSENEVQPDIQTPETSESTEDPLLQLKEEVAQKYIEDLKQKASLPTSLVVGKWEKLKDFLVTENATEVVTDAAGLNMLTSILNGLEDKAFTLDGRQYNIQEYLLRVKNKISRATEADLNKLKISIDPQTQPTTQSEIDPQQTAAPTSTPEKTSIEYQSPFDEAAGKKTITSGFGRRKHPITGKLDKHKGIDISVPSWTPIHAIESGKVVTKKRDKYGGNMIVVEWPDGRTFSYLHMKKKSTFEVGDLITTQDIIGYVGSTGSSTWPHLHLAEKKDGKFINPVKDTEIGPLLVSYDNYTDLVNSNIFTEDDLDKKKVA